MKSLRPILEKRVAVGMCSMYPAAGIIERIGGEWDWVWIDTQHGQHDYRSVLDCVRACDIVGVSAIVRVPGHDYGDIGRALDTHAAGVMVPMVNSAEEARQAVMAAKFAPLGGRSYGGRRPIALGGRAYSHTANEDTLLIAQIETGEAVENVDEIAAVPGVDALFYGPDDRATELGMPMDAARKPDTFIDDYRRVAAAVQEHGKFVGTPAASPEQIQLVVRLGFRLLICTGDVPLLASGSTAARKTAGTAVEE